MKALELTAAEAAIVLRVFEIVSSIGTVDADDLARDMEQIDAQARDALHVRIEQFVAEMPA